MNHRTDDHEQTSPTNALGRNHIPILFGPKLTRDLAREMNNMAELLHRHELVHFDGQWLTDAVHVVPRQIDEHDMFCAILRRREQFRTQFIVLYHPPAN